MTKTANIRYSAATLSRKLWLDQAATALLDYRNPAHEVNAAERSGLARYIDRGVSPVDAAELFQALAA